MKTLEQLAPITNERIDLPCRECGTNVNWSKDVYEFFGSNPDIIVCDPCCEQAARDEQEEKRNNQTLDPIENLIPQYYLETDFNLLPRQAQMIWRYGYENKGISSPPIQEWNKSSGRGIYILGASRTGKTRTMTTLLKRLHGEGVPFKLFEAGQFHASLTEAKRSNISSAYTRWRDDQIKVPVLAIDDLFAEKLTESIQAGLFEIIEQRMARKLPILITTQVKRSNAVKQFMDPQRGEALLNRLRESCDLYVTNQETEEINYDK